MSLINLDKAKKKSDPAELKGAHRYLKSFFITGVCLFGAVVFVTGLMNPFGLLETPMIPGINIVKPRMLPNARMIKAHQIIQMKPAGLILGSSRAETGINPGHPGWSEAARPVYNAALPSGRILELYAYLKHAHVQKPLKQVVLGLDFFSFDSDPSYESDFIEKRLDGNKKWIPFLFRLKDMISILFSYNALEASWETVTGQQRPSHGYLQDGSQDTRKRKELVIAKGGYFKAFESTLKAAILAEDGIVKTKYDTELEDKKKALNQFRFLVQFCLTEKIELYILISPVHAQWLEMTWQLGAWEKYEQWKKDVAQVVFSFDDKDHKKSVLQLWDFSGFHTISQELVPPASEPGSEMKWYWEASHYKREIGNMMLDRVLVGIEGDSPRDFGVRLSRDNIAAHLYAILQQREVYAIQNPDIVDYLQGLIHKSNVPVNNGVVSVR